MILYKLWPEVVKDKDRESEVHGVQNVWGGGQ